MMQTVSRWFWGKTRMVRYGLPVSLTVLGLCIVGLYFSYKADAGDVAYICMVLGILTAPLFVRAVDDWGTLVVWKP